MLTAQRVLSNVDILYNRVLLETGLMKAFSVSCLVKKAFAANHMKPVKCQYFEWKRRMLLAMQVWQSGADRMLARCKFAHPLQQHHIVPAANPSIRAFSVEGLAQH